MTDGHTEQMKDAEIKESILWDEVQEEQRERSEEPMWAWIDMNKSSLERDFCADKEDEFNAYCKACYEEYGE